MSVKDGNICNKNCDVCFNPELVKKNKELLQKSKTIKTFYRYHWFIL
jgi:sulfatase maturation enzyme AslB (radical SAM superfamily)